MQERNNVEVLYFDGLWYNFETGKWIVMLYDDDKTTEVSFPGKEVRGELSVTVDNHNCIHE